MNMQKCPSGGSEVKQVVDLTVELQSSLILVVLSKW